jgi:tripartite-type tricarboxylate transporter receptor subunit TctC
MKSILALLTLCGMLVLPAAHAAWPEHPVKIVVPTPAGGSADIIARTVAQELSRRLGQGFVIENKPGAAGNIGAAFVAKAPADGQTLLMHAVSLTVNPWLYKSPGYDIDKSFVPVAMLGIAPNIFFVPPDSSVKTLADLVVLAKKEPLTYASSGNGTTTHLGAEVFFRQAGIQVLHVPHAPGANLTAVAGGHVNLGSAAIPSVVSLAKSAKVRPIAVTGRQRSTSLPDVPTVAESGFGGFEATTWFALFAPAGTPEDVLNKLHSEIDAVLAMDSVKDTFAQQSIDITPYSRAALAGFVKAETAKWGEIVKRLDIKPN